MTIRRYFDFIITIVDDQETGPSPLTDAVHISGLELLDQVSTVSYYSYDEDDSTIVSVESESFIEYQIPLATTTSQKKRPVSRKRLSRPSRLEDDDGQDSVVLTRRRVRGLTKRNQVLDEDSLHLTRNRLPTTKGIRNHNDDEFATGAVVTGAPFYDVEIIIPLPPAEGDK
jgi:hypothetical protein